MRDFMSTNSTFYFRQEVDDVKHYRNDFKEIIHQREKNRIPFHHQSPQINYRKYLVEFMKKVCIDKSLSHSCLHLAVYLLDIFMDNHSITPDRIILAANVCILLAAKMEENSLNTPKIFDLNELLHRKYTINDYKNLEILILRFFDFYMMFPTAAHYTFYFMQESICEQDLDLPSGRNFRTLFYDLHEAITMYLDKIIDNIHFAQGYLPSKLAAAVISSGRIKIGLTSWTKQLEDLTEYAEEDLQDLTQELLQGYCPQCTRCM